MSDIAIKVEHLSKMYKLGTINNGTLFRDIQTWWALKRGKEDPHSQIGEDKYHGDSDVFWALKDVNFEIKHGDRVGIIGKNGAGKSTLLKVLSRITTPTEGCAKINGRISSLLEVGTGFHGELTGRENIYLNGSILGMKKKEIDRKLDEIIDFSGVEKHIDTPVKRYSSGMHVRLAFAVAAHLDSDILIADEVLAVGDVEFQKKALGKMQTLSSDQGRTILFVSHNMEAVKSLCNKGFVLEKGVLKFVCNSIDEAILKYTQDNFLPSSKEYFWENTEKLVNEFITINRIDLVEKKESIQPVKEIIQTNNYFLKFNISINKKQPLLTLYYQIYSENGSKIVESAFSDTGKNINECLIIGNNTVTTELPVQYLMPGRYKILIVSSIRNMSYIIAPDQLVIPFEILPDEKDYELYKKRDTILCANKKWDVNKI